MKKSEKVQMIQSCIVLSLIACFFGLLESGNMVFVLIMIVLAITFFIVNNKKKRLQEKEKEKK